jgi:hypothetical protein
VTSSIHNETILVKEPGSNKKRRVPKLLLEVPVRELHNLLVAPPDQVGLSQSRAAAGKIIVSDTTLRRIAKKDLPQLRRMSLRHMCGCEIRMSMHSMQKSLNAFRKRFVCTLTSDGMTLKSTEAVQTCTNNVLPNGESWYERPRHAIKEMQCPVVATCGCPKVCALFRASSPCFRDGRRRISQDCKIPFLLQSDKMFDSWGFSIECKALFRLQFADKKGRMRTRKHLTLLTRAKRKFMNDFYVPLLKQCALHHACVRILSKN